MPKSSEESTSQTRVGLSMVEVVIAIMVFAFAAIPIYYALSSGAAEEIDATKLAMARKILESFRSEMTSIPFSELQAIESSSGAAGTDGYKTFSGGCTATLEKVLEAQKKYKKFDLVTKVRISTKSASVLEFKGEVTWENAKGAIRKPEELAFIMVKP